MSGYEVTRECCLVKAEEKSSRGRMFQKDGALKANFLVLLVSKFFRFNFLRFLFGRNNCSKGRNKEIIFGKETDSFEIELEMKAEEKFSLSESIFDENFMNLTLDGTWLEFPEDN